MLDCQIVTVSIQVTDIRIVLHIIVVVVYRRVVLPLITAQAAIGLRIAAFCLAVVLVVDVVGPQVISQPVHQIRIPRTVIVYVEFRIALAAFRHTMFHKMLEGLFSCITTQVRVMRNIVFVIIYGLIILFICSQRAIPVVHVNISADATDRTLAGILPHLIAAIIAAGGTPFRHPTVPVFKNRICQVVVPPVQACIYTNIITLGAHNITEDPGNFRQTAVAQHQLTVFLQIIEHRQVRIMPLQQTNRMSGFVHSHIRRHRIGIEIYTVGNAQPLTFRNIAGPLLIVLFGQVHTVSAADDGEIHTGSFHCIPIDHTLMMAHINTPVATGRQGAHAIRQIKAQGIHLRVNALTILIAPAVLLTGLGQLIQPALPLCLQGHVHVFHCSLRIGQLGHHIL